MNPIVSIFALIGASAGSSALDKELVSAESALQEGRYEQALAALPEAEARPPSDRARIQLLRGRLYVYLGRPSDGFWAMIDAARAGGPELIEGDLESVRRLYACARQAGLRRPRAARQEVLDVWLVALEVEPATLDVAMTDQLASPDWSCPFPPLTPQPPALDSVSTPSEPAVELVDTPPSPPGDSVMAWTLGAGAVAVVSAGVAAGLGYAAYSELEPCNQSGGCPVEEYQARRMRSEDLAVGSNVAWGVAGAATLTAGVLLLIELLDDEHDPSTAILTPTGVYVRW